MNNSINVGSATGSAFANGPGAQAHTNNQHVGSGDTDALRRELAAVLRELDARAGASEVGRAQARVEDLDTAVEEEAGPEVVTGRWRTLQRVLETLDGGATIAGKIAPVVQPFLT